MTLGCQHSPSISGGVTQRGSRGNSESRLGLWLGVANVSRERESLVESRIGVENRSRECSREMESRVGVASGVTKWSRENKKFGGVCNYYPKGSN